MKKIPTSKKSSISTPSTKKSSSATKSSKDTKPKLKKEAAKAMSIEKACEVALAKLKELSIDESLQSEIAWCLGSYQNDNNPSGLYVMAKRTLAIFTVELASKTKGVTTKLIADLEKAIGSN